MKAKEKIEKIHVIEINCKTFDIMKKRMKKHNMNPYKINVYNAHIMDYVLRGIDPQINVLYLDVMCNYFDSMKTKGSQGIIKEVLQQLVKNKIVFAATFCLRHTIQNLTYQQEVKQIVKNLTKTFAKFGFNYTQLIKDKEMRYRGQSENNHGMMFVLYYLDRI